MNVMEEAAMLRRRTFFPLASLLVFACGNGTPGDGGDGNASTPPSPAASEPVDDTFTNPVPTPPSDTPGAPVFLEKNAARIIGITDDGWIAFATWDGKLAVVPVSGGTRQILADGFDDARTSGGAVGFWTGVSYGRGTFNVWTAASGVKTGLSRSGRSVPGLFRATADGGRIAFSVDATSSTSQLAVLDTSSATPQTTGVLTSRINVTSDSCKPNFEFTGRLLVGAYCASGYATAAELHVVSDGTAYDRRVDNATTGRITPYFAANNDASQLFVTNTYDRAWIVTVATGDAVSPDDDVAPHTGFFTPDGSMVV